MRPAGSGVEVHMRPAGSGVEVHALRWATEARETSPMRQEPGPDDAASASVSSNWSTRESPTAPRNLSQDEAPSLLPRPRDDPTGADPAATRKAGDRPPGRRQRRFPH